MKKILTYRVFDVYGTLLDTVQYTTTLSIDKSATQIQNDVKLYYPTADRFTVIEEINIVPHQVTDTMVQKGQSYSNVK